MKKQDQNMGQVEARSTDRLGSLGTALGVLALALLLSSYTLYKKAEVSLAQTCYEYTGPDNPSDTQATNPIHFNTATSSITCPTVIATLCGVCFEAGDFELDANNKPLFKYPGTDDLTPLGKVVMANWNNPDLHGEIITAENDKEVTLLFRAEQ